VHTGCGKSNGAVLKVDGLVARLPDGLISLGAGRAVMSERPKTLLSEHKVHFIRQGIKKCHFYLAFFYIFQIFLIFRASFDIFSAFFIFLNHLYVWESIKFDKKQYLITQCYYVV
jgi:hypothetical protein